MAKGKPFDVLVVGELNIDLILNKIEAYPSIGKEIIAGEMNFTMGSSAAIFACNLSTLGSKVAFMGKVGEDNFSEIILIDLKKKGVDISQILKTRTNTGMSVILNYEEDRAIVTYPGAMKELKVSDVSDETLLIANHLHVSSLFLQKALKPDIVELFKRAKRIGLTTSLDPQWDPAELWDIDLPELLPYVDIFLPNESELLNLTGRESIDKALEEIKTYGNLILIKKGKNGSVLSYDGNKVNCKPFFNNAVVDAIGAGDSFNAGFVFKYLQGAPPETCQMFGNLIGAISTTKSGGTTAFTDYEGTMKIAKEKFNYEE